MQQIKEIYQTKADDLPLLADFVRERGIHTFSKAEVIAAAATLPRREPKLLPKVQQWLCEILSIFADDIDPAVGDVMLLEAIIHCCIHTRCEAAKPMIIRMYSKYEMPDIMIPGGVNEVRKTIKRADIGVLQKTERVLKPFIRMQTRHSMKTMRMMRSMKTMRIMRSMKTMRIMR